MRIKLRKYHSYCVVMVLVLLLYGVLIRNWAKRKNIVHKKKNDNISKPILPILVLACNRSYVRRCLQTLIRYRPVKETFPIIVSQDCGHEPTYQIIKSFADRDPSITVVLQPDQSDIIGISEAAHLRGYYRIARHYKFALNHVFRTLQHDAVIVLEDDLLIAPDFYEYFLGTYSLLHMDPTIWCVSAWNDNCKKGLVQLNESALLHRTNFFPGLGWMMLSKTWEELEPHWPKAYFDDWLRNPAVSRGRVCIRPEISRTFNIGKNGVSSGQFYDEAMHFNNDFILFSRLNLSYLLTKYEHIFVSFVYSLPESTVADVMMGNVNSSWECVRVSYTDAKTFKLAAKSLGLMDDLRFGVARTSLHGIVQCFIKGRRVFLARAPRGHKTQTNALRPLKTKQTKKTNIYSYLYDDLVVN